ncbi:ArsR/SmtB family transcription factor [Frigidibacter oleivorans]|uniref:ArsR/SmtB family transcription factor n=1 Tax=Frigidibacter oleivorans TaxID=2487129 RepID=UPI000F8E63AB|nr:helix-turn-helix domain-containing protein [Frigidibacter oleivorans]
MTEGPDISRAAALLGDPARAAMLAALMRGPALTASELAAEAGVTASTASAHLARLEAGGMVQPRRQGRHRYFSLASEEVAALIEALMRFAGAGAVAGPARPTRLPGPRDPALRQARVCYNHLAGTAGVQLYDSLLSRGFLTLSAEGPDLTDAGRAFVAGFGLDLPGLMAGRPPLCRDCLDWSARRSHLGGRLGRAFLSRMEAQGWLRRVEGSRAIRFTPPGARAFAAAFPAPARDPASDPARAAPDESLDVPAL